MNKEEFLHYLSKKYEVKIIVDLPNPVGNNHILGMFKPEDFKVHLCEKAGICTVFHEIGHWRQFMRFIHFLNLYYKCIILLLTLPLPHSSPSRLFKTSLMSTLNGFFTFYNWIIHLNEEGRADYFACKTCGERKFPIEKTVYVRRSAATGISASIPSPPRSAEAPAPSPKIVAQPKS